MQAIKRFLPYAGPVVLAVLLALTEDNLLYRLQEQSLFLHTRLFFEQRMVVSGGFLAWVGCYLTQFFHTPALGAGLLGLLWLLLMAIAGRAFQLSSRWMGMTLVPVACLLLTIVDLGYCTYYLKLPGHAFDASVGVVVAVALVWVYRLMPRRYYLSTVFVVVAACVGYPLFGFYGLLAVAMMGIMAWHADSHRMADGLTALATVVAVPLACYHLIYHETNIVNIYWTALPVYAMNGKRYMAYNLPYIVLVVSLVALATFGPKASRGERKDSRGWWKAILVVVLAVTALCVVLFWYKDENFHAELAMSRSVEQQQWEKVLQTAKGVKGEPTRAVCMMKNLALARLGRQGDEMLHYPEGAKRPNAPFPVRLVRTVGKRLYLEYGLPNYCYRWCMEDGVEYGWTVERLKLMAQCSLLNGEMLAAQRYLNLLKKTDFQQRWVRRYETFMRNPRLMADDAELMAVHDMMNHEDFLTADLSQMERFLLEHFTNMDSWEPLLQEQTLIAAMQTKNMNLFWRQLRIYTEQRRENRLPTHFQEAACLFGHLGGINVSHMHIDPQLTKDYQEFAGIMTDSQRRGLSIDQIRPLVYDRFHTTYFYDFYFNRYDYIEK